MVVQSQWPIGKMPPADSSALSEQRRISHAWIAQAANSDASAIISQRYAADDLFGFYIYGDCMDGLLTLSEVANWKIASSRFFLQPSANIISQCHAWIALARQQQPGRL
jgi:hypothetical protein